MKDRSAPTAASQPARAASPAARPTPLHSLQQQVGNHTLSRTIQALRTVHGDDIPVYWDGLTAHEAQLIAQRVAQGIYILEGVEAQLLKAALSRAGVPSPPPVGNPHEWDEDYLKLRRGEELDDESDMDEDYDPATLSPDQDELFDTMEPGLIKKFAERENRKMPGKGVQGTMLEEFVTLQSSMMSINNLDANHFAMNIPGIDHVVDNPHQPFVQDKLHLSASTANPKTYLDHYINRLNMAKKLLEALEKGGATSKKIMSMFASALSHAAWINKTLISELINTVNTHRKDYERALNDDSTSLPSLSEDEDLVGKIGNAIAFSVPSDIWESLYQLFQAGTIPSEQMNAYIRMDMSTSDFIQVFELFNAYANPVNETTKPKDEDTDWGE